MLLKFCIDLLREVGRNANFLDVKKIYVYVKTLSYTEAESPVVYMYR